MELAGAAELVARREDGAGVEKQRERPFLCAAGGTQCEWAIGTGQGFTQDEVVNGELK